ncbi:MAG TPA: histone deacetylase [Candidatus Polarisedimenticolaceae bacterium]|nr:histone deacetylase [Candidatus Polarisedimenticolaceae bacterium]
MRRIGLVSDPVFERHDTGPGHPERPARTAAIRRALAAARLDERCMTIAPVAADDETLIRVHDPAHVRRVDASAASGARLLDSMDTAIGPESAAVARLAAGSVAALAREVALGRLDAGFAVVRPPGHHAERDLAMGFCLFNNVAVAAAMLRATCGVKRVLVVDWDVHHGNGTQHLFEDDPAVFYYSSHQMPLYPGTGHATERGRSAGLGATLNVPLRPGDGDAPFLAALTERLVPAMDEYRPDFVLVSAGFDAHRADPLGGLAVTTEAFVAATRVVRGIAERHAGGRLVSILEGGYDLEALASSAVAHLGALLSD